MMVLRDRETLEGKVRGIMIQTGGVGKGTKEKECGEHQNLN